MRKHLSFCAALLSLLLLSSSAKAETVRSVYDGDTLTLTSGEKIRRACIDTPEMQNTAKKKANKPAAIAARDYLISLINKGDLRIVRVGEDLYGRTIARVYTSDGRELSYEMWTSKHAVIFKGYEKPCPWAQ